MKKVIMALVFVALMAQAKYIWVGSGQKVTATTTPQVVNCTTNSVDYGYTCSIQNLGTNTVFVQLGTSTNGFVAAEAIPVNGVPFSFDTPHNETKSRQIFGVVVATTNGTAEINVAFN